jgi:hypothetical protein
VTQRTLHPTTPQIPETGSEQLDCSRRIGCRRDSGESSRFRVLALKSLPRVTKASFRFSSVAPIHNVIEAHRTPQGPDECLGSITRKGRTKIGVCKSEIALGVPTWTLVKKVRAAGGIFTPIVSDALNPPYRVHSLMRLS